MGVVGVGASKSFMRKIKTNNGRRRKSNVFSKLFDRFSGSKKKNKRKQQQENKQLYNMDDIKSSNNDNNDNDENEEHENDEWMDDEKEEKKEIELHPETLELQLCLEEDLNLTQNPEYKSSEETDNEIDEDDEELEIEFFNNDQDTDNDDIVAASINGDGVQMINFEALLSMYMTKGRILMEMKLLKEALDLYTYIINECKSLINRHHIQLEREYDFFEEEKENDTNNNNNNHNEERRTKHHQRRSNHDIYNNDNNNTLNHPYRRLCKNIGLENYYAAGGDICFKFKHLKNALRDFSNAIKYGKCKKEMGIYYNLCGVCYHEMKQYERALKDYDNAVKSMYDNHVAWNNRAALLVDMKKCNVIIICRD